MNENYCSNGICWIGSEGRAVCDLTEDPIYEREPYLFVEDNSRRSCLMLLSLEGSNYFKDSIVNKPKTKLINKYNDDKKETRITKRKIANIENIDCDVCNDKINDYLIEIYKKGDILNRKTFHLECGIEIKQNIEKCREDMRESIFEFIDKDISVLKRRDPDCIICNKNNIEEGYIIEGEELQVCGGCSSLFIKKLSNMLNKHIYKKNYERDQRCLICGSTSRSLKGSIVDFKIRENSIPLHKMCAKNITDNISQKMCDNMKKSYLINSILD
jgi:hypothetical protein